MFLNQIGGVVRRIPRLIGFDDRDDQKPWETAGLDADVAPDGTSPKKPGFGNRLLHALPALAEGAAGAGTPNIARGGGTDVARAVTAGFGVAQNRRARALADQIGMEERQARAAAREEQTEDRKLDRELRQAQIDQINKKIDVKPGPQNVGGAMWIPDNSTEGGHFVKPDGAPARTIAVRRDAAAKANIKVPPRKGTHIPDLIRRPGVENSPEEYIDVPIEVYDDIQRANGASTATPPDGGAAVRLLLSPDVAEFNKIPKDPDGNYYVFGEAQRAHYNDAWVKRNEKPKGGKPKEPPTLAPGEDVAIEAIKNRDISNVTEKYDTEIANALRGYGQVKKATAAKKDDLSPKDLAKAVLDADEDFLNEIKVLLDKESDEWAKSQQNYEKTLSTRLKKTVAGENLRPVARQRRLGMLVSAGQLTSDQAKTLGWKAATSGGAAQVDAPARPPRPGPGYVFMATPDGRTAWIAPDKVAAARSLNATEVK